VREFVVTLHTGKRYTVRADRIAFLDQETVGLVLDPDDRAVAVFDRRQVITAVAADHLISEADVPDVVSVYSTSSVPF